MDFPEPQATYLDRLRDFLAQRGDVELAIVYGSVLVSRNLFDTADFLPLRNRILKERRERWIGK